MNRAFLEKLIDRIGLVQPEEVQAHLAGLAREKGFLETIFNAILEGIIVTDLRGRILYLNRAAGLFFGVEPAAALGREIGHVVRGLDWEALSGGAVSRDLEVFYPENRFLNFYIVPLRDEEGDQAPVGAAMILRDITQTRRTTEETIESERFSALTLLAAGVAHEIGNPLNSLDIHLQLIQRRIQKLSAKSRKTLDKSIDITRREVSRLDQIITRFLHAIRPQPLALRPENLNDIARSSLDFLEAEARDRDILIETEFGSGIPLVSLDADQVKQAFFNIIRNAFQAMKSGGIFRVRTWIEETHACISFEDNGGGIPPENINWVFEPYFTTKETGSGLGLMIVRRIVRAHGGELAIESSPGRGLALTLRFPRADRRVRFLEPPKL